MPGQVPVATRQFSDYNPQPDLTETAVQDAIPTESYGNSGLNWPGGRGYRDTARAAGRAGRGTVARCRPGVRAADGARAAPVPDRPAAGRSRWARRAGPDGGLLHRPAGQRRLSRRRI